MHDIQSSGEGTGGLLIDAHCTRKRGGEGRGEERKRKNTTLRGTAKLAPPRRNAVLVLSACGQPTARFRRCAALPCVASRRRVYVAVRAGGAARGLGALAHVDCADDSTAGRSNGAWGGTRVVRSAGTFGGYTSIARSSPCGLSRSSVIRERVE